MWFYFFDHLKLHSAAMNRVKHFDSATLNRVKKYKNCSYSSLCNQVTMQYAVGRSRVWQQCSVFTNRVNILHLPSRRSYTRLNNDKFGSYTLLSLVKYNEMHLFMLCLWESCGLIIGYKLNMYNKCVMYNKWVVIKLLHIND